MPEQVAIIFLLFRTQIEQCFEDMQAVCKLWDLEVYASDVFWIYRVMKDVWSR